MTRGRGLVAAELFTRLHATALPVGTFDGDAWSPDLPGVGLVNRLWQGKIFTGDTVINRILGRRAITGTVRLEEGTVVIRYPAFGGLTDRVRPMNATCWLGRMHLGRRVIWFTLTQHAG